MPCDHRNNQTRALISQFYHWQKPFMLYWWCSTGTKTSGSSFLVKHQKQHLYQPITQEQAFHWLRPLAAVMRWNVCRNFARRLHKHVAIGGFWWRKWGFYEHGDFSPAGQILRLSLHCKFWNFFITGLLRLMAITYMLIGQFWPFEVTFLVDHTWWKMRGWRSLMTHSAK